MIFSEFVNRQHSHWPGKVQYSPYVSNIYIVNTSFVHMNVKYYIFMCNFIYNY